MRRFDRFTDLPDDARGASAAIGNFDGVHRGHQAVIALAQAAGTGPLGIVTFDPHPREYFGRAPGPFRLMTPDARAHRLEKLGVEVLFELPFDGAMARLSAEQFAREVIVEGLGLSHVTVGADFCFGKGRDGNADDLRRFGDAMGYGVTIAALEHFATGERVSSTRIREALARGAPRDAAAMLGHWHRIEGPVIHGEKRGRTLGYPTANMSMDGLHLPRLGVYAVLVDVLTGPHAGRYHGVASLGVRPMFGENAANLETYVFDFKGDLYDAQVSVALVDFLRPEMRFDGVDALVAQMDKDSTQARAILADLTEAQ
jgi:riboflavin kinase/FMN adenylyltransferase